MASRFCRSYSSVGPLQRLAQGIDAVGNAVRQLPLGAKTPFTGKARDWKTALGEAQTLLQHEASGPLLDAKNMFGPDLAELKRNVSSLLGTGHPMVNTVTRYYFGSDEKSIRPLLVLLVSAATKDECKAHDVAYSEVFRIVEESDTTHDIVPTQRRLAQITEMIHTASLLHDDILETTSTTPIAKGNTEFGNKMAILGGDFLLARASVALARLRNPQVIELMASAIANSVEGEFMQLERPEEKSSSMEYYMAQTYNKTASLFPKSCKSAAVLGGCHPEVCETVYDFAHHFGMAYQLIYDLSGFENAGWRPALPRSFVSAPVLFAWQEHESLGKLIRRRFKGGGDIEEARSLVYDSMGLKKTRQLATEHAAKAREKLEELSPSEIRDALEQLCRVVVLGTV
ncbi:hypothetical protein BZG36_02688 [Bifiguratus adelaidae]|uniref:Hexaprenyl pyrophosphate synthase, mitochondrial n=1 Tax=Bifiguratus adelaidae TaxID=1938954 RepID=A0A261Y1H1_9FUNG|nr:hypothetical protein BZG36_02688 [Bifiguratus adelaidae]